ncbi:unnamed protein product [Brachionus calyciflorus]|uniref:Endonuclease/exonuclease/phosphatase domain-containing protein n=1 Tax=Brachionus calyciflorus TaxID=104777 RepID=A0A813U3P8_9BILA|nr:unnamed protein product [Brachionus calyciflorus]
MSRLLGKHIRQTCLLISDIHELLLRTVLIDEANLKFQKLTSQFLRHVDGYYVRNNKYDVNIRNLKCEILKLYLDSHKIISKDFSISNFVPLSLDKENSKEKMENRLDTSIMGKRKNEEEIQRAESKKTKEDNVPNISKIPSYRPSTQKILTPRQIKNKEKKVADELEKVGIREEIRKDFGKTLTPKQVEEEVERRHKIQTLEQKKQKINKVIIHPKPGTNSCDDFLNPVDRDHSYQQDLENQSLSTALFTENKQLSPEMMPTNMGTINQNNAVSSLKSKQSTPFQLRNTRISNPDSSLILSNPSSNQINGIDQVDDPISSTVVEEIGKMAPELLDEIETDNPTEPTNIAYDQSSRIDTEIAENSRSFFNMEDHYELNKQKELLYPRKEYGAIIRGRKIQDFYKDIHKRINELNRCVNIKNPLLIQPVESEEDTYLKVIVDNYLDYTKLFGKWPKNAFKAGVEVFPMNTNLQLIILNVDKSIMVDQKSLMDMEKRYGLVDVERITIPENYIPKPTNKLKANAKTLLDFIEAIKCGIYLDDTSKRHQVLPNIMHAKICKTCGDLNHKSCLGKVRCIKCGLFDHSVNECKSLIELCINCGGTHRCNSELCEKLNDKTFSKNKYTIDIMLGEGLIKSKYEILKTPRPVVNLGNRNLLTSEGDSDFEKRMDEFFNKKFDEKFDPYKAKITKLQDQVNNVDLKINNLEEKITVKINGIKEMITREICGLEERVSTKFSCLEEKITNDLSTTHNKLDSQSNFVPPEPNQGSVIPIKIASINTAGLENNFEYINALVRENSIVCIQETWAETNLKIKNCIYTTGKNIYSKNAIRISSVGRPSGGIAFIVDQNFETKCSFLNDRIGILKLNRLVIFNLYLICNNSSSENNLIFQSDLELIRESIKSFRSKGFEILVLGDFNTDINKNNKRTKSFLDFVKNENFNIIDIETDQGVNFTYQRGGSTSWIDHVLCEKRSQNVKDVFIQSSAINQSDHNAISFKYNLNPSEKHKPHKKIPRISKPLNWNNLNFKRNFQERVKNEIIKLDFESKCLENEKSPEKIKILISKLLNEISSLLINSTVKTSNEYKQTFKKKKRIGELKFKKWWDESIQVIHEKLVNSYIKNKTAVDIDIRDLEIQYKNQFNKRLIENVQREKINKSVVENFFSVNSDTELDYNLNRSVLYKIIEELPDGKCVGFGGVSYEMLRHCSSFRLYDLLAIIFEKMIKFKQAPYLFNISIIKPLIKDTSKPNNDTNNLRPVAVSDSFANLFEAILLKEIEKEYKDHRKQFGFKENSSCGHAIFVLKQAIKISKSLKKRL